MSWFKKFADEIVEKSQTAPNTNQMNFLFDQKQLSLPITPQTPVAPEPEEPAPVSAPYNHNQMELPATEPIYCANKFCNNSSFSPHTDPTFIIDPLDGKPYCNEHFNKCYSCNDYFSTDHLMKNNRDLYCESCYRDVVNICPNCGASVTEDEILPPTIRNNRMPNGGCTNCASQCNRCSKVLDNDNGSYSHDGDTYCEDCFSDFFGYCDGCNKTVDRDLMQYVEGYGDYCDSCYDDKFTQCYDCEKIFENNEMSEVNGESYCESCLEKIGPAQYTQYTKKFEAFTFTKKDKYLDELQDLLPISVKDLKSKNPRLADGLRDLITFSKGKAIDAEMVEKYRESLGKEEFPVDYTAWSGNQRSIDNLSREERENIPDAQLAINVEASPQMLARLKAKPALYDLFDKINSISEKSAHPYVKDQIGWIRLELDPNNEYVLVEEIQCDHSNGAYKLKSVEDYRKANQLKVKLESKFETDDIGSYIVNEDFKEKDEDIKALRAIYKRKFQMKDEELDQMFIDKFLVKEAEAVLKAEYPSVRLANVLLDPKLQDNENVKTLREIYKKLGKYDDSAFNERLKSGLYLPYFPELSDPELSEDNNNIINKIRDGLISQYGLDDKGLNDLLTEYAGIMNDFPDIATKAVSQFARKNNFKKLYWHTYDSGMKLKKNEPPKSLYEKTPKDNFFKPTEEKPFGLNGQFFKRKASDTTGIVARKFMLKYAGKLPS